MYCIFQKNKTMKYLLSTIFTLFLFAASGQNAGVKIALVKYNGGGDWYSDPTALPNLIEFCNNNLNTNINPEPSTIEI